MSRVPCGGDHFCLEGPGDIPPPSASQYHLPCCGRRECTRLLRGGRPSLQGLTNIPIPQQSKVRRIPTSCRPPCTTKLRFRPCFMRWFSKPNSTGRYAWCACGAAAHSSQGTLRSRFLCIALPRSVHLSSSKSVATRQLLGQSNPAKKAARLWVSPLAFSHPHPKNNAYLLNLYIFACKCISTETHTSDHQQNNCQHCIVCHGPRAQATSTRR